MTGTVIAVVSPRLLGELAEVLARPRLRRWIHLEDAAALIEALKIGADLRPDPDWPPRHSVSDRDDDYLVALAEVDGSVIVSGDPHLLDAELDPPALSPRAFVELGWDHPHGR